MNAAIQLFWNNPVPVSEKVDQETMLIEIPFGAMIPNPSSGGGSVFSVNGKTGNVLLNAADVGAEQLGSVAALEASVDDKLALKADISDLSLKADKTYVDTEIGNLSTTVATKASRVYVDQQDGLLSDQIALKADAQSVNQALSTKADLVDGKVPASQLPSYVDDVLEGRYVDPTRFNDLSGTAYTPESGKLYVDVDTNKTYRWSGMLYVVLSSGVVLGETADTAYRGDRGKIAYDHSQSQGNPHNSTTSDITEGTRLYFTESRVRNTPLTGLVTTDSSAIAPTDTVVQALGKAQGQQLNLGTNVRSTLLTGLSPAAGTPVATDTILVGFNKLVGSVSAIAPPTWINVATLAGIFFHTSIDTANTRLEVAKINGNLYMRGYMRSAVGSSVPNNTPVVLWTQADMLLDRTGFNLGASYIFQAGVGQIIYSSNATTVQNVIFEQSTIINNGLGLRFVNALPANNLTVFPEMCIGKHV